MPVKVTYYASSTARFLSKYAQMMLPFQNIMLDKNRQNSKKGEFSGFALGIAGAILSRGHTYGSGTRKKVF